MIIRKPVIKMVGDEGSKLPVIQKFENKYSEEDLLLDFMFEQDDEEEVDGDSFSEAESTETDDDADWLNKL